MLNKKILLRLSLAVLAIMLTTGAPTLSQAVGTDAKATTAKKDANVIKGKVLGVSKKAKSSLPTLFLTQSVGKCFARNQYTHQSTRWACPGMQPANSQ